MKSNNEIARTNNNIPHQFDEVMEMIKVAKQKVFAAVNTSLIDLYWQVGSYISHQIDEAGWGKSVVEELANYIRTQEPNSEGFSKQNLWRMKQFYEAYKDADEKLSALLREISWTLDRDVKKPHENPSIGVLLCKSKDDEVVEYALSRSLSPTLVAEYELKLPNKALLQRKMQELAELIGDEQD
ncbi:MAG: PDDEXK nuclease domain-containing protein [Bacteroidales bacterium]|nr:PDDEXK nuclease domain-containing protein [Bacteroidales bacterium]